MPHLPGTPPWMRYTYRTFKMHKSAGQGPVNPFPKTQTHMPEINRSLARASIAVPSAVPAVAAMTAVQQQRRLDEVLVQLSKQS